MSRESFEERADRLAASPRLREIDRVALGLETAEGTAQARRGMVKALSGLLTDAVLDQRLSGFS